MATIIMNVPVRTWRGRGTVREAMSEVPAGFEPSRWTSPFLDLIGPVYACTGERGILLDRKSVV